MRLHINSQLAPAACTARYVHNAKAALLRPTFATLAVRMSQLCVRCHPRCYLLVSEFCSMQANSVHKTCAAQGHSARAAFGTLLL
jgi:hypothetical protein